MWQIEFILPKSTPKACLDIFSEVFETTSVFETDDHQFWQAKVILTCEPSKEIVEQITLICTSFALSTPEIKIFKLPEIDWLAENRKAFPPLNIAGFYIHGSHISPPKNIDLIPIQVDASLAFGTGEHATTQGCLEMIASLQRPAKSDHILDLGCGTAILAIAMAKLWHCEVLAADIDADSVKLAQENCKDNIVDDLVQVRLSDGFSDPILIEKAPYSLIVANILAGPLCILAPEIKKYTTKNAEVILSGLLVDQQDKVLQAYYLQGFELFDKKIIKEWATLHLKVC